MPQSPLIGQPIYLAQNAQSVPASGVTVDDAAGNFDFDNLENVLEELVEMIDDAASLILQEEDGSPTIAATSINVPNATLAVSGTAGTLYYIGSRAGARQVVQTIAASGAAQTLDLAAYNTFDITLTANCTLTFSNAPPNAVDAHWTIVLRQGGSGSYTVTFPAAVTWQNPTTGLSGGSAPTLYTAVGSQNVVQVSTTDGGTTYGGSYDRPVNYATPAIVLGTAAAAGSASSVIRSDSTIVAFDATLPAAVGTAAVGVATVAARRDHVHGPGTTPPTAFYRPLMDGAGAVITDGGTGEAIMAYQ